jgi:hypothetical protein
LADSDAGFFHRRVRADKWNSYIAVLQNNDVLDPLSKISSSKESVSRTSAQMFFSSSSL